MKLKTSVLENGGSIYVRVPPAMVEHLGLKGGIDNAIIRDRDGKYGKYCEFWGSETDKGTDD